MKYIIYFLIIVLHAIQHVAGDTFVFQQDSASACKTIQLLECKTPDRLCLSGYVDPNSPNLNLVDYKLWDHATAGLSDDVLMWMNSRSDWLKSGLVWSRTLLTVLSMHGETVCVLVFAQRADISNIDL